MTTRGKAREFIQQRNYKQALKLCKGFDQLYNKPEIRILQIAYECYSGNEQFYKSIDIKVNQIKKEAIDLLTRMLPPSYCSNTKIKNEIQH